jgi:hypothetical protein
VLVFTAGIFAWLDEPRSAMEHALRYFLMPLWLGGFLSLLTARALLERWRAHFSTGRFLGFVSSQLVVTAVLWAATMHAGTWLEWRERRTPVAYASEWFYAEAYQAYLREPQGRLISATVALSLVLPASFLLAPIARRRIEEVDSNPGHGGQP